MTGFSERSSGILLHPTSLPGPHGVGDLGPAAHRFLAFLARAGQRYWQMLPVGPVGAGASPYDSPSAFAGSPLLISLERLAEDGLLEPQELLDPRGFSSSTNARYRAAERYRERRLRRAFARFEARADAGRERELHAFLERSKAWLPDFTLFRALKKQLGLFAWTTWDAELRKREPLALERARRELAPEVRYQQFLQFEFDRQWSALREHARDVGVALLGDVPMFVAHDGSDVWANQGLFQLDEKGERRAVAGVPPDYFSQEGQRWGNPLYDWKALRNTGYAWWIERLRTTLERFDALRLDHFIGFHRYWEIPSPTASARDGRFAYGPGEELFSHVRESLGSLPFIAEDLGLVTPEVHALRDKFELPGMRVLAFAFGEGSRDYQPHRFARRTVVYTGTHDNDTLCGWLSQYQQAKTAEQAKPLLDERKRALAYAGSDGREAHWDLIRLALMSVADTAIFPLQDLLGLGSSARMNVPGTAEGNWVYRARESDFSLSLAERLANLCTTYERGHPTERRSA